MAKQSSQAQSAKVIKIADALMLVMGILVLFGVCYYIALGARSYRVKSWPRTEATVVDGGVEVKESELKSSRGRPRARTAIEIEFTYQVDGKEYTGTRYSPYGDTATNADLVKFLGETKKGGKYDIYYKADDPSESYFTHGYDSPSVMEVLWLTLATIIGIVLFLQGFVHYRRMKAAKTEFGAETELDRG